MQNWRINVKNFGKIKEASIEVAPFTLFVGDNNSGKSYLMSLIYGVMELKFSTLEYKIDWNTEIAKKISGWIDEINEKKRNFKEDITKERFQMLVAFLNEVLNTNIETFVQSIFNTNIGLESIELDFDYNDYLHIEKRLATDIDLHDYYIIIFEKIAKDGRITGGVKVSEEFFLDKDSAALLLLQYLVKLCCFDSSLEIGIYLPTSRTGFLLTYKSLIDKSLDNTFNAGKIEKNLLTRPCSNFLSHLPSITDKAEGNYLEIADFIESEIMRGQIHVYNGPIAEFRYLPKGKSKELPMFLTSGVITEMTPLVLMLRHKKNLKVLMMEEPEMCLHPKLQWVIARVLIKLVNSGAPVIVTTHSDNILQHINNMLKLTKNNDKIELMKKYGYEENDLINREQIRMYQFNVNDNDDITSIEALEDNEYGFVAPTFNKMLVRLLEESRAFEGDEC